MAKLYLQKHSLEIKQSFHRQNNEFFCSEYEKSIILFIDEWFSGKNKWHLKTSGSTGTPKEIILYRDLMEYSARQTIQTLGLNDQFNALLSINANFVGGKMMLVRALMAEMNLVIKEPSTKNIFTNNDIPIDFAAFVPMQIYSFLKNDEQRVQLNNIQKVLVGGAPLHVDGIQAIQSFKTEFYQTYGMTETYSHVALKRLNGQGKNSYFSGIGDVIFSTDEQNRLIIKGSITNQLELKTNDIVELIDEKHFNWKGRHDFVINSGGIKIHPEQLESKISITCGHLLRNKNYFIAPKKDKNLGEKVVLYIEGEFDTDNLFHTLRKALPKYEIPKEIREISNFTYTSSGKVNRSATLNSQKE